MNKDVYLVRDGEIPDKYRFLEGINEIPSYDELDNVPIMIGLVEQLAG